MQRWTSDIFFFKTEIFSRTLAVIVRGRFKTFEVCLALRMVNEKMFLARQNLTEPDSTPYLCAYFHELRPFLSVAIFHRRQTEKVLWAMRFIWLFFSSFHFRRMISSCTSVTACNNLSIIKNMKVLIKDLTLLIKLKGWH